MRITVFESVLDALFIVAVVFTVLALLCLLVRGAGAIIQTLEASAKIKKTNAPSDGEAS